MFGSLALFKYLSECIQSDPEAMENLDYDSDWASSAGPDTAPAVTTVDTVTTANAVTTADAMTPCTP